MHSVICSGLGSLECFVIIKCTKFGQLILRKIIKIVATRCQILSLKYTKFDFGFAPDPAGGAYSAPQTPFKRPTSKGRGREGGERGRKGKGGRAKGEGRGKRSPCSDFTI